MWMLRKKTGGKLSVVYCVKAMMSPTILRSKEPQGRAELWVGERKGIGMMEMRKKLLDYR